MSIDDVAKYAYDSFRHGFGDDRLCPAPSWGSTQAWIRDVVKVGVMTGALRRQDVLPKLTSHLDPHTVEECAKVMDRRAVIWRNGDQGPCSMPLEEECEDGAAAIRSLLTADTQPQNAAAGEDGK